MEPTTEQTRNQSPQAKLAPAGSVQTQPNHSKPNMTVRLSSPVPSLFVPEQVFFEPASLDYPLGKQLYRKMRAAGVPIRMTTSHNQVRGLSGKGDAQTYRIAKKTLVVGVKRSLKFEPSKPSAEYALPLGTGCIAHCHYCYLNTNLGSKPYVRVYVNVDEILDRAKRYIEERAPEITRFEAACTSDPLAVEHLTGSLQKAIRFMAGQPLGRLRFVTKFHFVDPLLDLHHGGHTRIRFSLNADFVVKYFEPATSPLDKRMEAAEKAARAGYPVGFILAPLYRFDGWEKEYGRLLEELARRTALANHPDVTFELIQHRFTSVAKSVILQRYPKTKLVMEEQGRKVKWGKYGRTKYVYRDEEADELKHVVEEAISRYFPQARIEYFT